MALAYEKANESRVPKRIDKVFSNRKSYTHKAEYLERLANPSLEKWNFIQLNTVAHTESDVCQLQSWISIDFSFFERNLRLKAGGSRNIICSPILRQAKVIP